ncbi:MAG TPA: SDR family NAD(P)-dependent oxidoreductase, partial [Thermoanaerobaculia bacterium]|nr:SDR family NAD(P)-dependent oxidoreductase [Thermoanaerobaculia bacterium]
VREHPEQALGDVAYSLAATRSHHEHRLALAVSTREALVSGLEAALRGELAVGSARGEGRRGKTAWLFTGQGSQQIGMGRELWEEWPVFREALEAAWSALDGHLEAPLREVMWSPRGAQLDETGWTQPALFALEVALSALWRSWGVEPDMVAGHSIGELSAAYVAGVFSLEDAARLVAARGRLMQALPRCGAMVSLAASESAVAEAIGSRGDCVSIAAVNGPSSVVISGAEEDVLALTEEFASRGVRTKRLTVSHAFHSALMDPMLEEFRGVAESVLYRPARIEVVSNVSGGMAGSELSSAAYWVKHVREGVRFSDGVGTLHAAGVTEYVEVGPQPTLLGLVAESLPAGAPEPVLVASLRPERSERAAALAALGSHYAHGGRVDWAGVFAPGSRRVDLPTYAWQRQRYWIETSVVGTRGGEPTGHPLLGVRVPMAGAEAAYESVLSRSSHAWLYEHRVGASAVMPGAGVGELVRAAGEDQLGSAVEVLSLVLQAPVVLPEEGGQRVQVVVKEEDGRTEVSVYSQRMEGSSGSEWTLHASGEVRAARLEVPARLDVAAARGRCGERIDMAQAYEGFASAGLEYGAAFQGLQALWRGTDEAVGEVSLPEGVEGAERYGIHPALLDAAFQSVAGIARTAALHLPFAMDKVTVHRAGAASGVVHVRRRSESGDGVAADVTLADEQGEVLVEVAGLRSRPVEESAFGRAEGVASALYQLSWTASPAPAASPASGRWLVVAGEDDAAAADVVERLRQSGVACERVTAAALPAALPAEHVVCLWRGVEEGGSAEGAHRLSAEGLSLVQLVAEQERSPRLWWATRGAVSVTAEESAEVAQASLWGLGRTVMQEHPELSCTLIDLEEGAQAAEALVCELTGADGEQEIAWRGGQRHVARLTRASGASVPAAENYSLVSGAKGALDGLVLVAAPRRRGGRGEVEIEVRASGLNFRDVLNALGMYPGEAGPLGSECAGVVTAVGEGVEGLAVGDRVMALVAGGFGRYVVTDARLVARVPSGLSLAQAATIPVAFLTAWYALHDLAELKAGERLLVHAAAGGVGMAAVQIARWIGAEVFGTASAPKWDVVRSLGVKRVASSRDLSFVEEMRSAGGVDVVLNALSGEFVDASLSLLDAGGRFIEMGKTDIREPGAVSASHPGVRYRAFDLSEAGVDRLAAMLRSIVEGFASGQLRALPVRTFAITEGEAAFRFMAQARHVGKLALLAPRSLRCEGTVLITGGLGSLGLHVARWLAGRGVKHLVLTGRRGAQTPGASAAVEELRSLGSRVTVASADVSSASAVREVLAAVPPDLPLRGVVHAARVLDDGVLREQSAARFARVLSAKVDGACHLDALTRSADLDLFVLFSSASGTLGSGGQGGYAAANACLDAVASRRRAAGLAGQSLAWGLWTDGSPRAAGLASRLDGGQRARLERSGLKAVDPAQGLALLEASLCRSEAQLMPVPLDLVVLRRAFGESVPPVWRGLVRPPRRGAAARRGAWARELAALPEERRLEAALEAVRAEVARVLSLGSSSAAAPDRPLKELGLDSLMAVELRNALGRRAGVTLPATLAFDHPTPAAMAK